MIKKIYLTVIICCLCGLSLQAQYAYFGSRGTISFDKVTYTKARMRQLSNDMSSKGMDRGMGMMEYLDKMPDSHTEKLNFYFDENSTVLMPEEGADLRVRSESEETKEGNLGVAPTRTAKSSTRI